MLDLPPVRIELRTFAIQAEVQSFLLEVTFCRWIILFSRSTASDANIANFIWFVKSWIGLIAKFFCKLLTLRRSKSL